MKISVRFEFQPRDLKGLSISEFISLKSAQCCVVSIHNSIGGSNSEDTTGGVVEQGILLP